MLGSVWFVLAIIGVAFVFDFINGFHDSANSIATVVSTRVLTPKLAVAWAAFFNFVAAFGFGTAVAKTIGSGMIDISLVDINGPKGGVDKECRVTVRLPGLSAIHVTEAAETLHGAIDLARDRLENALKRTLERRRDVSNQGLPEDVASNVPTY